MRRTYDNETILAFFSEIAETLSRRDLHLNNGREERWEVEIEDGQDTILVARGTYYSEYGPTPESYGYDSPADDPDHYSSCSFYGLTGYDYEEDEEYDIPLTPAQVRTAEEMIAG